MSTKFWYTAALAAVAAIGMAALPQVYAQETTAPETAPVADTQGPPPPDAFGGPGEWRPGPRGGGQFAQQGPRHRWNDNDSNRYAQGPGMRGPGARPEGPPPGPGFGPQRFGGPEANETCPGCPGCDAQCPRGPRAGAQGADDRDRGPRGQRFGAQGAEDRGFGPQGPRGMAGGTPPGPPDPELIFERMDADNDNAVSRDEFVRFHAEHRPPHPPMHARRDGEQFRRPQGPPTPPDQQ